ncbi:MAG: DUF2341 domain-containing protein, partial [Chitinivibrionales bacterium]|nr:DUF2341 domain-containing protein [Chitinivibrionales bacterium]
MKLAQVVAQLLDLKGKQILFLLLSGLVLRPVHAEYSAWQYHKTISINTSADGADISSNVSSFPLLVRLNSGNFDFSQAKSDGADIRFETSDSNAISYEIEQWNSTALQAVVWVLAPQIQGSNATQYIKMYWGNSAALSESDPAAVFQAGNNFKGV